MKDCLGLFVLLIGCSWHLSGASATPVAIVSLARAANVVTVTCTGCGIVASQGFSINGVTLDASFNTNGTALTATANSFTFAQTGGNVSIGAGGTVVPAKQIIILTASFTDTGNTISGVFWITTTNGLATAGNSAWSSASVQEKNAIAAGTTIEVPFSETFAGGTVAIQTEVAAQYARRQARQNAVTTIQPGQFFGGFYDGSGWSF